MEIDLRVSIFCQIFVKRAKPENADEEKLLCIQWNSTRCVSEAIKGKNSSKRGKVFSSLLLFGMFAIIVLVTFLIEFRLPNFSKTRQPSETGKCAWKTRVINCFPFRLFITFTSFEEKSTEKFFFWKKLSWPKKRNHRRKTYQLFFRDVFPGDASFTTIATTAWLETSPTISYRSRLTTKIK